MENLLKRKIAETIKTWITNKSNQPLLKFLEKQLQDCRTVLDVGCGIRSPLAKIPKKFYLEGIDLVFEKKDYKVYDKYKKGDILEINKLYKQNSFDACAVLDVIEHLKKDDGFRLLENLEKVAKKKIIILTPNGYRRQVGVENNPYEKHLSGWKAKDFEKLGYKCYGIHGYKPLRGRSSEPRYKPWYVWLYISHLTQFFTFYAKNHAFHIIAVKTFHS